MTAGLDLGTIIAGCRIEAVRSRGATWTTYQATHLQPDEPVALTVVAPGPALARADRACFNRAVELAATVDHPSLLAAREWGESDGTLYLLTPWIEGWTSAVSLPREGPYSARARS